MSKKQALRSGPVVGKLFSFLFFTVPAIAAAYRIKRFHRVAFKVLDNGSASLTYNCSHLYSPPLSHCRKQHE